jgi:hypothetical protein
MLSFLRRRSSYIPATLLCASLFPVLAHAASSFKDVPATNPASPAIEFLKEKGILQGYADGTFRPKQEVKRSEAVKIIVSTKVSPEDIAAVTGNQYADIAADAWYRPYVEAARGQLAFIDGPPKATEFHGERAVTRAEFLKMLFKAQGISTDAYSELQMPLSADVTDATAWYYPAMRFALSASMISVDTQGALGPGAPLTRAEVADLIYRLAMYQSGRRTQALLSEEESDLINVLQMLDQKHLDQAGFASGRALIASRGALASKPTAPIVQGAVKTAEAFRALVRGYDAGVSGDLTAVLSSAKDAWTLADKARQLSPALDALATQVQTISKQMADQARVLQGQSSSK